MPSETSSNGRGTSAAASSPNENEKRGRKSSGGAPRVPRVSVDPHRTLPHSVEAEQGVLGSMLIAPREVISVSVQRITDKHFYVPAHAMIYQVLVEFWNENKPIDFITLTQVLKDRELLDQVGGPFFVTSPFTFVPTAANANYYIDIVREKYILRQIIIDCT